MTLELNSRWKDNDPRMRGRVVVVVQVTDDKAKVVNSKSPNGRATWVKISSFGVNGTRGYSLFAGEKV